MVDEEEADVDCGIDDDEEDDEECEVDVLEASVVLEDDATGVDTEEDAGGDDAEGVSAS